MDERKLIYADDAIEAIDEITWYHQNINNEMVRGANSSEDQAWYKAEDVYEALEQLPSVQPEIIRCKDCKYWMRAYLSISGKHGCNVMRDYTAPDDYCFKAEKKA